MKRLAILCSTLILILLVVIVVVSCQEKSTPPPAPAPAPAPAPTPPAAAPTETPSKILFEDDFSNEAGSGWDTFSDSDGMAFYQDGALHIKNYTYAEYDSGSYYRNEEFADFAVGVETMLVDGTDDNCHHVFCRAQDTYEANHYAFIISADGYYGLAKIVDDEIIEIIPMTRSIHVKTGKGVVNLMLVECIGDNLRLFVNGNLLVEVVDASFTSGYMGLGATGWTEKNGKTYTEIAFDNIEVTSAE